MVKETRSSLALSVNTFERSFVLCSEEEEDDESDFPFRRKFFLKFEKSSLFRGGDA